MSDFHPCCPPPTGLVRPVRVDPDGTSGPTRGAGAGPRWRTSSHGLRVTASAARTVEQRILEAAVRLPAGGMVTGWAALRLAGASWFDGLAADGRTRLPAPALLPHTSRIRGAGIEVTRTRRVHPEAAVRFGIPCAPGELALLHELRRATSARRAGVAVDMALAARVVDLDRLRDVAAAGGRLPVAGSYALGRACAECRSPKESEMLQVWETDLGFPRPLMNRQVLDLSSGGSGWSRPARERCGCPTTGGGGGWARSLPHRRCRTRKKPRSTRSCSSTTARWGDGGTTCTSFSLPRLSFVPRALQHRWSRHACFHR